MRGGLGDAAKMDIRGVLPLVVCLPADHIGNINIQ